MIEPAVGGQDEGVQRNIVDESRNSISENQLINENQSTNENQSVNENQSIDVINNAEMSISDSENQSSNETND